MGISWALGLTLASTLAALCQCQAVKRAVKVPWTTDEGTLTGFNETFRENRGRYGPDGPWQALVLLTMDSGYDGRNGYSENTTAVPVWPINSEVTELPTTKIGARYSPERTGDMVLIDIDGVPNELLLATFDRWVSPYFASYDNFGTAYIDNITLMDWHGADKHVNATVVAAERWNVMMRDGRNYTAQVGNLGLSPISLEDLPAQPSSGMYPQSIIEQLRGAGAVDSNFWSLHMGSVPMEQSGSFVIGGYEQNRALGHVGIFDYGSATPPMLHLLDVFLGVEEGGSPFNVSVSQLPSVYRGPTPNARSAASVLGAKAGTTLMLPNPGSPGIYLPLGTCEAAASYLPVTWDNKTGYYLWDVEDPRFARIVNSPAYLGFVLADRTATNLTIKVPFQLLNLTLEAPITESPTPYFPCHSMESELRLFAFGRAFLQATFLAVSYDTKSIYMAQAPGPEMDQSVLVTLERDNETITSNPIESFAASWRSRWTILDDEDVLGSNSNSAADSPQTDMSPNDTATGLSTGGKAGVAVGSIFGAALVGLAAFFLWRRGRKRSNGGHESIPSRPDDNKTSNRAEMGTDNEYFEAGAAMSHEVEAREKAQEAPPYTALYEMGNSGWQHPGPGIFIHELPTDTVERRLENDVGAAGVDQTHAYA